MNPVSRAFELAKTGNYRSLDDLRRKLKQEKYESVDQHISGKSLGDQLKTLMRQSAVEKTPSAEAISHDPA